MALLTREAASDLECHWHEDTDKRCVCVCGGCFWNPGQQESEWCRMPLKAWTAVITEVAGIVSLQRLRSKLSGVQLLPAPAETLTHLLLMSTFPLSFYQHLICLLAFILDTDHLFSGALFSPVCFSSLGWLSLSLFCNFFPGLSRARVWPLLAVLSQCQK